MTDFEQRGKLILPAEPPPTYKELRDAYDLEHAVCPQCGSEPGERTCMGYVVLPGQKMQDRNHTSCTNPACGWKGIVDDLVPPFDVYDEYYRRHCCCPQCGHGQVTRTCMSPNLRTLQSQDRNRAICNHSCGWEGIVDDLVPEKP